MIEYNILLEDEKSVSAIRELQANLHKDEVLRFRFTGLLMKVPGEPERSQIEIELSGDLKFCLGSRIRSIDLMEYTFSPLDTLPDWEKLHPGKWYIFVDFEAKAVRFVDNVITLMLPDSYERENDTYADICECKTIYLPEAYTESMSDFVTIDFETLNHVATDGISYPRLPISVGMVKVKNGDIVEKFSALIKPPVEGEWKERFSKLTSEHCQNARDYKAIYPFIESFMEGLQPVAYNCSTERGVFRDVEKFYHLRHSFIHHNGDKKNLHKEEFIDPLRILRAFGEKDNGLAKACMRRGIYHYNTHDALSDAEATAKLLLKLDMEKIGYEITTVKPPKPSEAVKRKKPSTSSLGEFIPEEEVEYPDNPFNRKIVCCTGFSYDVKADVELTVKKFGAKMIRDIRNKKFDILVVGPVDSQCKKKIEIADSCGARIMRYKEFKDIFSSYGVNV